MQIESTLVNRAGQNIATVHIDIDSIDSIGGRSVDAAQAFCFYHDKLVIVYSDAKKYWTPPGGGVEPGETVEHALIREVLEETNMRVLKYAPISTLEIFEPTGTKFQVRFACLVEPVGQFVADVDEHEAVTEIKCIDPADVKKYFDWGVVGDRVLERALQIRKNW